MGEFWGLVSAPEAASAFYLQIGSMQNAEAVQETEGNASPPPPPPDVFAKPCLLFQYVSARQEPAGIIY